MIFRLDFLISLSACLKKFFLSSSFTEPILAELEPILKNFLIENRDKAFLVLSLPLGLAKDEMEASGEEDRAGGEVGRKKPAPKRMVNNALAGHRSNWLCISWF